MRIPSEWPRLKGYRFPREVVAYAVWAYHRFALGTADVEDLLAERGVAVSRETLRKRVNRFGRHFADCIKRDRPAAADKWHLDEVVVPVNGVKVGLWRAVDANGMCSISLCSSAEMPKLPGLLSLFSLILSRISVLLKVEGDCAFEVDMRVGDWGDVAQVDFLSEGGPAKIVTHEHRSLELSQGFTGIVNRHADRRRTVPLYRPDSTTPSGLGRGGQPQQASQPGAITRLDKVRETMGSRTSGTLVSLKT